MFCVLYHGEFDLSLAWRLRAGKLEGIDCCTGCALFFLCAVFQYTVDIDHVLRISNLESWLAARPERVLHRHMMCPMSVGIVVHHLLSKVLREPIDPTSACSLTWVTCKFEV